MGTRAKKATKKVKTVVKRPKVDPTPVETATMPPLDAGPVMLMMPGAHPLIHDVERTALLKEATALLGKLQNALFDAHTRLSDPVQEAQAEAHTKVEEANNDVLVAENTIKEMQKTIDDLRGDRQAFSEEVDRLRAAAAQKPASTDETATRLASAESQLEIVRGDLKKAKDAQETLRTQLAENARLLSTANTRLEYALKYVPAENGSFKFPDGGELPAGGAMTDTSKLAAAFRTLAAADLFPENVDEAGQAVIMEAANLLGMA